MGFSARLWGLLHRAWPERSVAQLTRDIMVTPRTFGETLAMVGLSEQSLGDVCGKRILSCAEGLATFARDLESRGAIAIAIDRVYTHPREQIPLHGTKDLPDDWLVPPSEVKNRMARASVAGDAARLPFAADTFDRTVAANLFYWYLEPYHLGLRPGSGSEKRVRESGIQMIAELMRVTKPRCELNFNVLYAPSLVLQLRERFPTLHIESRSIRTIAITKPTAGTPPQMRSAPR